MALFPAVLPSICQRRIQGNLTQMEGEETEGTCLNFLFSPHSRAQLCSLQSRLLQPPSKEWDGSSSQYGGRESKASLKECN